MDADPVGGQAIDWYQLGRQRRRRERRERERRKREMAIVSWGLVVVVLAVEVVCRLLVCMRCSFLPPRAEQVKQGDAADMEAPQQEKSCTDAWGDAAKPSDKQQRGEACPAPASRPPGEDSKRGSQAAPTPQQGAPMGGPGPVVYVRVPTGHKWMVVRQAFILKVYALLSLQLAITVAVIALFVFEPTVKLFVQTHMGVYIAAFVCFLVIFLMLMCCGELRKRHPCNLILLFLFTLSFAYMLGVFSSYHSTYIVFMAAAITAAICLLVTMIATFSSVDITGCGALLCVLGLGVFVMGIVLVVCFLIWGHNALLLAIYAGLVGIVFTLYLMFDTQLIMGGRYMELSPDEVVYATLMLYVDIANIFWALLTVLGYCCGD